MPLSSSMLQVYFGSDISAMISSPNISPGDYYGLVASPSGSIIIVEMNDAGGWSIGNEITNFTLNDSPANIINNLYVAPIHSEAFSSDMLSGNSGGGDNSNQSGASEIFASDQLENSIGISRDDNIAMDTAQYYSISPTGDGTGFDLQAWAQNSGVWETVGDPVAGISSYTSEADMMQAFISNNVQPEHTVHMNSDMPANLYSGSDLTSAGFSTILGSDYIQSSSYKLYAVIQSTPEHGVPMTQLIPYIQDLTSSNWVMSNYDHPIYVNGNIGSLNGLEVATGDQPGQIPQIIFSGYSLQSIFSEIPSDDSGYYAVSQSHNGYFQLQPLKYADFGTGYEADGAAMITSLSFDPSALSSASSPMGSWTPPASVSNDGNQGDQSDNQGDQSDNNQGDQSDNQDGGSGTSIPAHTLSADMMGLTNGETYVITGDYSSGVTAKLVTGDGSEGYPYVIDDTNPITLNFASEADVQTFYTQLGSPDINIPTAPANQGDQSDNNQGDQSDNNQGDQSDNQDGGLAIFGKVYQIDTMTHFESLIGSGHGLTGGMTVTFMPSESGSNIVVQRVMDNDHGNGKTNDYVPENTFSPVVLKSTYSTETNLETYLSDNGIVSIGTMLKRVEGSNPDNRLEINDSDFEGPADSKTVWSIDEEAFLKQAMDGVKLPDVDGNWTASYDSATDIATFTKVVEVNGVFVPDSSHNPIVFSAPTSGHIRDIAMKISGEMTPDGPFNDIVNGSTPVGSIEMQKQSPIEHLSVDIAIPLSDKFDFGDGYDNRSSSGVQINSLAFVPGDKFYIFDEAFISFENNFENDLDKLSFKFTGGRIEDGSHGGAADNVSQPIYYNLVGNFGNLHSDGFLNLYAADDYIDGLDGSFNGSYNVGEEITYNTNNGTTIVNGNEVPIALRLGAPNPTASNNGDMDETIIPGGSNGVNLGLGNDYGIMGVSDISSYTGHYQGGNGWDYLDIETDQGGMIVDFYSGLLGDENSAFVTWTEGGNTGFTMSEFEALMLSDGNDTVLIGAGVGENLTTQFDSVSFLDSQSMFRLEAGNVETDNAGVATGTDYLYINSDSNIYLSFNYSYNGVTATFDEDAVTGEQSASITGYGINTYVEETGGAGQLIDAIKTTENADTVVNNGSTGITVDLGGTSADWMNMSRDTFIGSATSEYDLLDAREGIDFSFSTGTVYNPETATTESGIQVTGSSEMGEVVNANLINVDYIMVRDNREDLGSISDDDEIWNSMYDADVDFYKDMSSLYGEYQIDGLGTQTSDAYGQGYDVHTSALLENFGDKNDLTIYYDGNHSDFIDLNDKFSGAEGVYNMAIDANAYTIGADWAQQVEDTTGGSVSSSFYVDVAGKKVAVSHDGTGWKVDNTALFIAQDASANITGPANMNSFTSLIADRYNITYDQAMTGTFTNDIYLNATEQQINEVLDSTNGVVTSTKAFNFGFYTKFQVGDALINIKLSQNETGTQFTVNENDVDLMVENIFNRVDFDGAGVSSGGKSGNFVKVDDVGDVALGNGGNDTYVIETSTMGTALEYGDINTTSGGLSNSEADSVNFAGISNAADLNFSRDAIKNEANDSTLIIDDGSGSKTSLFDNYNTYFDFRRIEYLTVDDAANNNEIFEISVDGNNGIDDGNGSDLEWDNEIVVADNQGDTIYADGGTDILVGGTGADVFNIENVVGGDMADHSTMSHVHIKNISSDDSIVMDTTDVLAADETLDDGMVTVTKTDSSSYMLFTDDEEMLRTHLDAVLSV